MKRGVETLDMVARNGSAMPGVSVVDVISPMVAGDLLADEATERPTGAYELGSDGRPVAEFGNRFIMEIPRNVINVLPQIRREFDPVKLQELSDSMPLAQDFDGLVHELMEPVVEGLHTEQSATRYLDQYNRANIDNDHVYTIDDLIPWHTESRVLYVINIAGERRLRAMDILIEKHGYSAESRIWCSVHKDITYVDALPKQFMENNARVNPSKPDEARSIRGYIDLMREVDPSYTQKECAAKFAVRPEVVHDAIVFTNYPNSLQAMEAHYPYTWIIDAEGIYNVWLEYYKKYSYGVINPMSAGIFGADTDKAVSPVSDNMGIWTASDGAADFRTPEDAAAHEVEICFVKIKAEQLARRAALRKNEVRKARDVRLPAQLLAIKAMLDDEARGIGQDSFYDSAELTEEEQHRREIIMAAQDSAGIDESDRLRPDEPLRFFESYAKRRAIASGSLFEAALQSLRLLDTRGDLTFSMRERLGSYALVQCAVGEGLVDISQADKLVE